MMLLRNGRDSGTTKSAHNTKTEKPAQKPEIKTPARNDKVVKPAQNTKTKKPAKKPARKPAKKSTTTKVKALVSQQCPLMSLPMELKIMIYELLFQPQAGQYTLKRQILKKTQSMRHYGPNNLVRFAFGNHKMPDRNMNRVWARCPKRGMTAILSTCRQVNHEVTDIWARLPQSYQCQRLYQSDVPERDTADFSHGTFRLIPEQAWQNFHDLTLSIPSESGIFIANITGDDRWIVRACENIQAFATTLAASHNLRRLHIVPTRRKPSPYDIYAWGDVRKRFGTRPIQVVWLLLKPFACLPAEVKVTTHADWDGFEEGVWFDQVGGRNCYEQYARIYVQGFEAMRKVLAGKDYRLDVGLAMPDID